MFKLGFWLAGGMGSDQSEPRWKMCNQYQFWYCPLVPFPLTKFSFKYLCIFSHIIRTTKNFCWDQISLYHNFFQILNSKYHWWNGHKVNMNNLNSKLKNWMENTYSINQLPDITSLQNFAHVMTAQLSWHVQNSVVILVLEWKQK